MRLSRFSIAAVAVAFSVSCTSPTENQSLPITQVAPPAPAFATSVTSVTFGNSVTVGDAGWSRSFGGVIDIESDATVVYAVVFGGSGGSAPVTGVTVGGVALTRVKQAQRTMQASLDVFRLTSPATGTGKAVAVTRSNTAYDPARVTFFTVRGASSANPNDAITEVDLTPGSATATRTVQVASAPGSLTISAVSAGAAYLNGTGVVATPGFQTTRATGEDQDGAFAVLGSAPGAASVTHSYNLKADAAGRPAYLVSFNIKPGSTVSAPVVTTDGSATFGSVTTLSDNGWTTSFGGTLTVESDATVAYAVVFGGTGGKAPVSGVSIGGRPMTRIKRALHTAVPSSVDVFRLVTPAVGAGQAIAVTRGVTAYDPVRVSVFTVRGANITTPNDSVLEVDISPGTTVATKTLVIPSSPGALTISAVGASAFVSGTGVTATPGFQVMRASGQDADGNWGVLGSAPGASPSVTHSYDLRANAPDRPAYAVRFNVFGGTLPAHVDSTPPPPIVLPAPPDSVGGWKTVVDYDYAQIPPLWPGIYQGWSAFQRTAEGTFYSNLSFVNDPTQPGTGSPGAARTTFLTSLPGGYAPVTYNWGGPWPTNDGSLDITFTIKFPANWDNNGPKNTNDGVKLFFFASKPQNNHVITVTSSRYDGATLVGDPTLGGIWVTVALQNPTISFKTNMNLARGAWHTVRVQTIANTPGVANGRLRVWVDGVQALINTGANDTPKYLERTNVMYFSAGQVARQDRLQFEPTYTGSESPPYAEFFDLGHVMVAVRPR